MSVMRQFLFAWFEEGNQRLLRASVHRREIAWKRWRRNDLTACGGASCAYYHEMIGETAFDRYPACLNQRHSSDLLSDSCRLVLS